MDYNEFLNKVIDEGIAAVREDYANDPMKLEGATNGFEACRDKEPQQLIELLAQARVDRRRAIMDDADDYWRVRCREAEIEWVCNCVSVVLMSAGDPVIVQPTANAAMRVIRIVGAEKEAA